MKESYLPEFIPSWDILYMKESFSWRRDTYLPESISFMGYCLLQIIFLLKERILPAIFPFFQGDIPYVKESSSLIIESYFMEYIHYLKESISLMRESYLPESLFFHGDIPYFKESSSLIIESYLPESISFMTSRSLPTPVFGPTRDLPALGLLSSKLRVLNTNKDFLTLHAYATQLITSI
jgi:hypothetical protein